MDCNYCSHVLGARLEIASGTAGGARVGEEDTGEQSYEFRPRGICTLLKRVARTGPGRIVFALKRIRSRARARSRDNCIRCGSSRRARKRQSPRHSREAAAISREIPAVEAESRPRARIEPTAAARYRLERLSSVKFRLAAEHNGEGRAFTGSTETCPPRLCKRVRAAGRAPVFVARLNCKRQND